MKRMKKFASLLLAMVMVLAMTITGLAAGEGTPPLSSETQKFSITVTPQSDRVSIEGQTYYAYKLFDVTYDLTNNAYAYTISKDFEDFVYSEKSGEQLINYIGTLNDNAEDLNKVAEAALHYLESLLKNDEELSKFSKGSATVASGEESATIDLTEAGYYLVAGKAKAVEGGQEITAACALTTTNPAATVNVKADAPELTKKIVENETKTETNEDGEEVTTETENLVDANSASVGADVTYEIESNVPAMTGYEKYYFIVHDTLSKGLDYNSDSLVIKMNPGIKTGEGEEVKDVLVKDTDYTVESPKDPATGETKIKIVFKNFIQYRESNPDAKIIIRYSATINQDAVIGVDGNPNKAKLQYSNNPNTQDGGKPDEPDEPSSDKVTGETPEDIVLTYIAGVDLLKVADNENGLSLKGAEFQITGEKVNKVAVQTWDFVKVADGETGEYYKLKDGTYTKKEPIPAVEGGTTGTADKYESQVPEYKKATTPNVKWETRTEAVDVKGTVGEDGILRFDGLGDGTYYIEELVAPNGYNILKERIKVEITCKEKPIINGNEKTDWDYHITYVDDKDEKVEGTKETVGTVYADASNVRIAITVVNKAGSLLPSTGGIGRTIFYAAGIILMAGAMFFVVRRKRA